MLAATEQRVLEAYLLLDAVGFVFNFRKDCISEDSLNERFFADLGCLLSFLINLDCFLSFLINLDCFFSFLISLDCLLSFLINQDRLFRF